MELNKNVPTIRFNGFEDEWEEKEFKENIVSIQTGTNLLGSTTNSGTPLIKMGNLQRGYFSFEKVEYLSQDSDVEKENIVNFGDFLFNTRNTLELVGKGATWMGESGQFAFNNNIARFIFKGIDTVFFNYLYNTQFLLSQVQARAMGTTSVAAIYPQNLNSIVYGLPQFPEQTQIGNFFKTLDGQINAQEQKHQKLVNLKKAMLEKMFPKEGADVPEIRFNGFTEKWEEKKLGDVSIVESKKNNKNLNLPVLTNSAEFGVLKQSDFFDKQIFNTKNLCSYIILDNNEFVYNPRVSSNAPFGPINRNKIEKGLLSPLYSVFKVNGDIMDLNFVEIYFKTNIWHKYMLINGNQGARSDRMSVNKETLVNIPIYYTTKNEQQKIGEYFEQLDTLIQQSQVKIKKYKNIKQALLQKMFV